jgi:hypothetical protein
LILGGGGRDSMLDRDDRAHRSGLFRVPGFITDESDAAG